MTIRYLDGPDAAGGPRDGHAQRRRRPGPGPPPAPHSRKYVGAYLAALGRADAIVFTGGVGESDGIVRARSLAGLEGLGIAVDPERNMAASHDPRTISPPGAQTAVLVVPTDEGLEMPMEAADAGEPHEGVSGRGAVSFPPRRRGELPMARAAGTRSVAGVRYVRYTRRITLSTILIGVDESTHSEDAIAFGRRVAAATSARVALACAFPYSDAPSRAGNLIYRQAVKDGAVATVRRMERLLELPKERVETIVTANTSPAHALHDAAEETGAALVVVGHTRHGHAGRIVPGATAERLLNGAPCPVAIVPDGYRERPAAAIRRVGVAYVDTAEGRAALTTAVAAARAFGARLEVISAVPDDLRIGRTALVPQDLHEEIAAERLAKLETIVNTLRAELWAEAVLLDGDPAQQLAAHSAELDLMIMGSRGYGPLRSVLTGGVSGRVSREAHCPVIVVPRGVEAPFSALFDQPAATTA